MKVVYEFTIHDHQGFDMRGVYNMAASAAKEEADLQGFSIDRIEVSQIQDFDSLDNCNVYQVKVYTAQTKKIQLKERNRD